MSVENKSTELLESMIGNIVKDEVKKAEEDKGENLKTTVLIHTLIHRLQVMTGYHVAVQFSVNQDNLGYVILADHPEHPEQSKAFPVWFKPEDMENMTDAEMISKTFIDIFAEIEGITKTEKKIILEG